MKGARLDSQCKLGRTALILAIKNQFTKCLRLLVQSGCDVNSQLVNILLIIYIKLIFLQPMMKTTIFCVYIELGAEYSTYVRHFMATSSFYHQNLGHLR